MYQSGSGTALDPFLIANAQDLNDINSNMSAYFKQTQDITLGSNFECIGWNNGASVKIFTGNYDGQGFTIKDGTINYPSESAIGIWCSSTGTHSNIKLSNIQVTGNYGVGALVGHSYGAPVFKMENCHTDANCVVTGNDKRVGGLVGYCHRNPNDANFLSITACSNKANVSGFQYVGGIVGYFRGTRIENCYNTGEIYSRDVNAGGIIGEFVWGRVNYCYNSGNISALDYGGGIVGLNNGQYINNCYALNNTITRTSGTSVNFGRISGNSSTSHADNNYALDTMQFIAL